ncbi:helicase HerA domain-containing protein [Vibrio cholerae]
MPPKAIVNTALECEHEGIFGASGSGKSYYIKNTIIPVHDRVLVWDIDGEYGDVKGMQVATTPSEVIELMRLPKVKIRYTPRTIDQKLLEKCFQFISLAAFVWGDCCYIAEELADVTTPSKAAGAWGIVLRRGRKRAVKCVGVSQRPAECDKTLFTQAQYIRTGRLDGEGDKQRLATTLGVPFDWVNRLAPLEYLSVNRKTGELTAGKKSEKTVIRKDWNSPIVTRSTK